MDFTPDDAGNPAFPHDEVIDPYQVDANGNDAFLEWTTEDWDPALRYLTLPYDPQLVEWLKPLDASRPFVLAGREFGGNEYRKWQTDRVGLLARGWLEPLDLEWQPDPALKGAPGWAAEKARAYSAIRVEIEQLQQLMQDDRDRYLAESDVQADGVADTFYSFVGVSQARYPWTVELINCGISIGNLVYMYYKQYFHRVRPSVLCPGLIPPFGPPAHPAYPSGHSTLGHLIALLLLEIPALRDRYGVFAAFDGSLGQAVDPNPPGGGGGQPPTNPLQGRNAIHSPLLWFGQRMAKNRERIGVHYPSDSFGSRHIAAGVWRALLHDSNANTGIDCPTLKRVLDHAKAEWPVPWR
jgi:hypothetical protein